MVTRRNFKKRKYEPTDVARLDKNIVSKINTLYNILL